MLTVLAPAVTVVHWAIVYWSYFPYHDDHPSFGYLIRAEMGKFYPVEFLIGLVLLLMLEGWQVWRDYQIARTKAADLERQLAVARLDALRMQLQPHFLFNTLHAVAGLIVEQPPAARRMVIALGDLLRLTLKEGGGFVRSLAAELEFADLYLEIERIRFGDHLVIDYDIEPEATVAEVPQLLLQPLFENAVRHGAARISRPCAVRFKAVRDEGLLRLSLRNDGPPAASSTHPPPFGVGLSNTLARLRLNYGESFDFRFAPLPEGGADIEIAIPYTRSS
jgi:LytS/YehU family sensor histidine kinase